MEPTEQVRRQMRIKVSNLNPDPPVKVWKLDPPVLLTAGQGGSL